MQAPATIPETTTAAMGTSTALSLGKTPEGRGANMVRLAMLMVMVVIPGGLLVLAAFILARTVAAQMQIEQGPQGRRFARAVASVKLRDVWSHARRSLR